MPRVYLVDCHDSFSYNLVELLRSLKVDFKVVSVEKISEKEIEHFSHLLLSPGPKTPKDYPELFQLLKKFHQQKSILGVCLGHQTLGEFFGASLEQRDTPRHGEQKKLFHHNDGLFLGLPKSFNVGLYHSWQLSEKNFPNCLKIIARCDEGSILSFQHQYLPIYGVQFHPESIMSDFGRELLENWLKEK